MNEQEAPMPQQTFEEALDELLLQYEDEDLDSLISTLELKLMALKELAEP